MEPSDLTKILSCLEEKNENIIHTYSEVEFILQNLSYAVLLEDSNRKIRFVNKRFCDLFNIPVSPDKLVGADCDASAKQAAFLFLNEDFFIEEVYTILKNQVSVYDEELFFKDGRVVLRDYLPIVLNEKLEGHLWVYKDFTKFKMLERRNVELQEFYEKVLNNIPADIAIFNTNHQYLFVNKNAFKDDAMRNWIIGKDDYEYFKYKNKPSQMADYRRKIFLDAINSKQVQEFSEEQVSATGKKNFNVRRFYPYVNDNEEIEFIVGYGININTIKEKESELLKSEELYRNLINNLDELVFSIDEQNIIQYVNPSFEQKLGIKSEVVIGSKLDDFFDSNTYAQFSYFINAIKSSPKPLLLADNFIEINTNTKGINYFKYYLTKINRLEDNALIISFFLSDINDRVNSERHLKELVLKEKELNKLKTDFINLTSHQMKTPLTVIKSCAELVEKLVQIKKTDQTDIRRFTDRISLEVDKMSKLINQVLVYSKFEKDDVNYSPEFASFAEFALHLAEDYFSPWADGRALQVEIKGNNHLQFFDRFMMNHVLVNILDNAFKYSANTEAPLMRIYLGKYETSVLVTDKGVGIETSEIPKIGKSFYRGNNIHDIPGNGLGLSIANSLIRQFNGTFKIRSQPKKGTTVFLSFPSY